MPLKWFGIEVAVSGPGLDGLDELRDAGERFSAETPVGELFEPAFD